MGDRRFDAAYEAIASSKDRAAAIADKSDAEVIHALAAASRRMDAYVANILAVEVLNRRRKQRAALWGAVVGLGASIVVRTILFLAYTDDVMLTLVGLAALLPCGALGYAFYRAMLARRAD